MFVWWKVGARFEVIRPVDRWTVGLRDALPVELRGESWRCGLVLMAVLGRRVDTSHGPRRRRRTRGHGRDVDRRLRAGWTRRRDPPVARRRVGPPHPTAAGPSRLGGKGRPRPVVVPLPGRAVAGTLVGTFDWELVADTEAVIAGFAAACYAQRQTSAGGLSAPEDVAAFLRDYDSTRAEPLSTAEQRTAAAGAVWICDFTARWQVALLEHDRSDDYPHVTQVQKRQDDYLTLKW